MNKTIKVIDLFNWINEGNYIKLPLNIMVDGKTYKWDTIEHFYKAVDDGKDLLKISGIYNTVTLLDMEVEIIEESEQDIDIQAIEEVNHYNICSVNRFKAEENINDELSKYSLKINELVRAIKKLDNKIKEK